MDRLLVVSPHLDDAVFGCGELIASRPGATVATLFAGAPASYAEPTSWDRDAGFSAGDDVVAARREEDRAALEILGATPLWMDFVDDQYEYHAGIGALVCALSRAIEALRPDVVLFPAGLFHADHRRTHEAALLALGRFSSKEWQLYEDALYRRIDGLLDERLRLLDAIGLAPRPIALPIVGDARERKRRAVACYGSQLRALGARRGHGDVFAPEGYWRISGRGERR
jgi:LmbE family N-acetylglucosaminyl deacetylase